MGEAEPQSAAATAQRISDEIAAIHVESYGERVESIRTEILDDLVVCYLDIRLMTHEQTLLDRGCSEDAIRAIRRAHEACVEPAFSAAVEHSTGRRVIAFLSDTHIDPPFNVEFFKLAPSA